jgi:hypothetical protein
MLVTDRRGEMISVIGQQAWLRMNPAACYAKHAEACWGGRQRMVIEFTKQRHRDAVATEWDNP